MWRLSLLFISILLKSIRDSNDSKKPSPPSEIIYDWNSALGSNFTIPFLIDGGATHPILIRTVKFKKNYQHTVCMTDGNTIDPFHNFLIPNFFKTKLLFE